MIEFESGTNYSHSELLNLSNSNLGVNRSDLYAPHINASKNMNKNLMINDYLNYDDGPNDDIYDFSESNNNMIQQRSYIENNNNINNSHYNYDDDDDEDEDDINFDYEYGYDYERVIKDRLRKVNQEFDNDQPPNRKSVLVSFDNAVTAIDISIEEQQRIESQERVKFEDATDIVEENNNVVKLPLNDTVQRDDPDAFANQVRIRNSMYDAQLQSQNQTLFQEEKEEEAKSKTVNIIEAPKQQKQDNSKNSSQNSSPTFNSGNYKSSTPSPPIRSSPDIKQEAIENNKYDNSDWADSSQTRSDDDSLSKSNDPSQITEKQKAHINNHNNRLISFSIKHNEDSPSPISSSSTTPEPIVNSNNNALRSQSSSSIGIGDSKEHQSSEQTTERTVTEHDSNQAADDNERILVERDGVFKLMTTEEHTAYEKQKKQEALEANNKESSDTTSAIIDKTNINKSASSSQVIPRPPPRAKTDNQRPKSSIIQREVNRNSSLREKFNAKGNENANKDSPKTMVRMSRSADPARSRTRSKSINQNTPEYASNYKSPYHNTQKIVRPGETAEEKKKRLQEARERKELNDLHFLCWVKSKEKEKDQKLKLQKKQKEANETANGTMTTSSEDKNHFDAWLLRKRQQLESEKEYKKTCDQYKINETQRKITPEERNKAYKDWLSKKIKEKNDLIKQEKMEQKKWSSKRRRSRKHQRLSQALELAQAYGYNSSYRSPGPFNY